MQRLLVLIAGIFVCQFTWAQGPRVPSMMDFAGIKLHINDKARREIQTDVDNIRRSETYFRKRVEKIDLHFPVIERIFKEEKLPDDFKYLVIQESALVSDAVSSSNAVGFWQFKKETGLEMNLRIDNMVDERLNLASSSRAAAKYMKKNNFYFDNWLYALLAYNTGRGGAEKYISDKNFGKNRMDITGSTHWYVKKFLAHKIAYQDEIGKQDGLPFFLFEYTNGGDKTLKEVAKEFEIDLQLLEEYNKCFKKGKIPSDKVYSVLIPIGFDKAELIARKNDGIYKNGNKDHTRETTLMVGANGSRVKSYYSAADQFPRIKNTDKNDLYEINGRRGTIAKPGDNFDVLAIRGGLTLDKFKEYNDLTNYDKVKAGQVYYFEKKAGKAKSHYHTLLPGQTMWDVSQKYGLRLNKLLSKNRLEDEGGVKSGLVLWLRYIRPRDIAPEYHDVRHLKNQEDPVAKAEKVVTETTGSSVQDSSENEEPFIKEEDMTEHIEVFEETDEQRQERREVLTTPVNKVEADPKVLGYEQVHHEVVKGDTYFSISKKYRVDIVDLLEKNNLKINDVLSIGQMLVVDKPVFEESKDTTDEKETMLVAKADEVDDKANQVVIHKVTGSETLYGIAKKYNVTIKEIMEWNDKEDFVIKQDEELKIILK